MRRAVSLRTSQAEDAVLLEVEDNGTGMEAELLPRLFEPFAPARRGDDGQRLALCKALARRFHGLLRGENRAEGGMIFTLELRPDRP